MRVPIRHCQDVDERLVGHRDRCSGKFEIILEPRLLAWRWKCNCGYECWMMLSNVKHGKFEHWFDITLPNQVQSMVMKVNGILVVNSEVPR